jgi:hypothetical protein
MVETPRHLSGEQKELLQRLRDLDSGSAGDADGKKGSGIFHRRKNGK